MTSDAPAIATPLKQPPGLYLLFGVEMWERFSYYGMRALLILFLVDRSMGGWGWTEEAASELYKWYTSLVYLTPIIGGYLADRWLGTHKSLIIGGIIIAAGHFCLALPGQGTFFAGLGLVIIGTGFFKSNVSTMVGELYPQGDGRRDGGFTIFYIGINVGAFVGQIICGLGERPAFGWHFGFGAAGVGMVIGLITYVILKPKYLAGIGDIPASKRAAQSLAETKGDPAGPLNREEKQRVWAIFFLVLFDIMFWLAFEQAGSSMNLFAFQKVDRYVLGWQVPASWLQSVNPLAIMVFGSVFASMWVRMARRGREPSTPVKFALGLFLLGAGFLVLVFGARITDGGQKASLVWLLVTYVLHTWGELAISPVGLSMVTKLAPLKFASVLMGAYFVGHFVSHQIAGALAGSVKRFERGEIFKIFGGQADFFLVFVFTSVAAGILLLILSPKIKTFMHGRA